MMNNTDKIQSWMEKFKSAWLTKDIDAVFNLFSDYVEYWETPFQKIGKGPELRKAWEEILPLENMQLLYEVFVADNKNKSYAVKWNFSHTGGESAGTYLIILDGDDLCRYFYHSAQSKT